MCGYIYEDCEVMCRPIFYRHVNEAMARQGQDRGHKVEAYSHDAKASYHEAIARPRPVRIYSDEGFMVQSVLAEVVRPERGLNPQYFIRHRGLCATEDNMCDDNDGSH